MQGTHPWPNGPRDPLPRVPLAAGDGRSRRPAVSFPAASPGLPSPGRVPSVRQGTGPAFRGPGAAGPPARPPRARLMPHWANPPEDRPAFFSRRPAMDARRYGKSVIYLPLRASWPDSCPLRLPAAPTDSGDNRTGFSDHAPRRQLGSTAGKRKDRTPPFVVAEQLSIPPRGPRTTFRTTPSQSPPRHPVVEGFRGDARSMKDGFSPPSRMSWGQPPLPGIAPRGPRRSVPQTNGDDLSISHPKRGRPTRRLGAAQTNPRLSMEFPRDGQHPG